MFQGTGEGYVDQTAGVDFAGEELDFEEDEDENEEEQRRREEEEEKQQLVDLLEGHRLTSLLESLLPAGICR